MKARWFQLPHSDYGRINYALAFYRALYPRLPAPGLLMLANLAQDYWDNPGRYR